jgi:cell division protein FtsN
MGSKTKKQTSPEMKKKGSLLLFSLLFFTSAWMFILGVLVGRGCAPLKFDIKSIQDRLAELSQKEQDYYKIDHDAVLNKTSFGFYEDLKKTETKDKSSKRISSLSSKKSFKKKYLLSKPIDNQKSDITPKNRTQKKYTIQVASLKDSKLADKLVAKLKKMRYPAYKSKTVIPGKGTWFRIRIGSYKNKADAGTIMNRLQKDKFNVMLVAI